LKRLFTCKSEIYRKVKRGSLSIYYNKYPEIAVKGLFKMKLVFLSVDFEGRAPRQKSLDTKLTSRHVSEKSERRKDLDISPNIKRKRDRHHARPKEQSVVASTSLISSDADSGSAGVKEKVRSRSRKGATETTTRQKVISMIENENKKHV